MRGCRRNSSRARPPSCRSKRCRSTPWGAAARTPSDCDVSAQPVEPKTRVYIAAFHWRRRPVPRPEQWRRPVRAAGRVGSMDGAPGPLTRRGSRLRRSRSSQLPRLLPAPMARRSGLLRSSGKANAWREVHAPTSPFTSNDLYIELRREAVDGHAEDSKGSLPARALTRDQCRPCSTARNTRQLRSQAGLTGPLEGAAPSQRGRRRDHHSQVELENEHRGARSQDHARLQRQSLRPGRGDQRESPYFWPDPLARQSKVRSN